jgi:HEAT repeat protein
VEFQQGIWAAIPTIVESLKDSDSFVRQAALQSLSGFGAQGMHSLLQPGHFVAY